MSQLLSIETKCLVTLVTPNKEQDDNKPAAKKFKTDNDFAGMPRCSLKLPNSVTLQASVVPLSQPISLVDQSPTSVPNTLIDVKRIMRQAILRTVKTGNLKYISKCLKKYSSTSDKLSRWRGLANKSGETPLIIASVNGHINVVRFLVETAKVDLNEYGTIWSAGSRPIIGTALHAAVILGNLRVLNYLSEVGLQVDQSFVNRKTRDGSTPLHLAAVHLAGKVQRNIVHRLLFHGADFTINDSTGKQCWQPSFGLGFTMLLVEFLNKFGVTANIEQIRNEMDFYYYLLYFSAKCIIDLRSSK